MVQSLYTRACCRPTFSSFRPIQENRKTQETDVESKQEIIKQSIASYRGSYPCSYIPIARKGAVADAAQTAGGAAPLWYEKDVMQKMVDEVSEEDVAVWHVGFAVVFHFSDIAVYQALRLIVVARPRMSNG
jgi:hypothetical protein